MKFVCSRDMFINSINTVQKAVSPRTTLPILEGILIVVEDNVKLTGYDLETGIECTLEADISEKGSIVINSRILGDIIKRLPDDMVSLEKGSGNNVLIESGNSHFSIKGINPEGYPKLPTVEEYEKISIEQNIFKEMISKTIFAVSTDESRPVLNGCKITCEKKSMEIVAIDGFRLALRKYETEKEFPEISFIVPGKSINEASKIMDNSKNPVEVFKSSNHILFDTGKVKLISRLIAGEYMNYKNIIPDTAETKLTVSTKELLYSIERASLIITSEERKYPVRFKSNENETLEITTNTDIGSVKEEVGISLTGKMIDVDFNPRYFIDALKVIEEEEISINFSGNIGPCVIKPLEGDEYSYLVLPLRR